MFFKTLSITVLLCLSFFAVAEDERSIEERARAFADGTLGEEMDAQEAKNYIEKRMKSYTDEEKKVSEELAKMANQKPISYSTEFRLDINLNNFARKFTSYGKCVSRNILLYLAFI